MNELWAAFDFLMPNFLGTASYFQKEFAKPITMGHLPDASAESINGAMEKLKLLHQQVLPFILRREKGHVLKELPPKCITDIPCPLSPEQQHLYTQFCEGSHGKKCLSHLQRALHDATRDHQSEEKNEIPFGSDVLKSLLFLRLLCTHPTLVKFRGGSGVSTTRHNESAHRDDLHGGKFDRLDCSGKLMALSELLRSAGICADGITAADNDSSLLYCDANGVDGSTSDEIADGWDCGDDRMEDLVEQTNGNSSRTLGSKCLIFAQFNQSLDVVEQLLFEPHMPSLRYVRLDGRVPQGKRTAIVDSFNSDDTIKVMLLTTRIGGLGLNLTGTIVGNV